MKNVLIRNSLGEMSLEFWAEKEYKRVNLLMKLIEDTFSVDLNTYPELRKAILDTSNYIRRIKDQVSEVSGDRNESS